MSILGFIKDVVLLPVDIALDLTMITPVKRIIDDNDKHDQPFGTLNRLESIVNNIDDTMND